MLVNAAVHPGPALWQAIMLCGLPLMVLAMSIKNGRYLYAATGAYVAFGVALFVWIISP